jgi:RNA polymerase sigma-70 factor (TIGR02954 family)
LDIHNLVQEAMKGKQDAFYELMQLQKIKLYKIAFSFLKNEEDSLEAIQEVTYRAYSRIKKLKQPQYFSTWLIRIMLNYCSDELKKKNRMSVQEIDLENSALLHQDGPQARIEHMEMEALLKQIDPKYQVVIQMKYIHDLTISDIATAMDRPEGTIKTWLNKALKSLRILVEKEGGFHA